MEPTEIWTHRSVLVVDDEQGMRNFLEKTIALRGAHVACADSAEQAEGLVRGQRFDVVVLDIALPGKSGIEFLRELREHGFAGEVILITAFADLDTAIEALRAGASDFIGRTLQQSIVYAQARVERGLTLLASVGSTAPFVGLFGTVWGIYHALIAIGISGQASIDKVAGPVGEALIMTAAGLFVAIPAVLAYNAFTRANRLVLAQLDGFANGLHAYLVAGVRLDGQTKGANVTSLRARPPR